MSLRLPDCQVVVCRIVLEFPVIFLLVIPVPVGTPGSSVADGKRPGAGVAACLVEEIVRIVGWESLVEVLGVQKCSCEIDACGIEAVQVCTFGELVRLR